MTYIQGFLIPVPMEKQEAYRRMAADAAPLFKEYGARRVVECWGDDVPDGQTTDMKRAVQATGDENVVFAWIIWPDRATCDKAADAMMKDERMKPPAEGMPFDPQRMIYAGFSQIAESGADGPGGYVDGIVVPVPSDSRDAYVEHARTTYHLFTEMGAIGCVDGWGEDVPEGKVTDFNRAVQVGDGETVGFGWISWPDKATRDAAWETLMADPRMSETPMPFDGKRMIWGGFRPIFDTEA